MKSISYLPQLLFLIVLFGCSKSDNIPSNKIEGTWAFTNQLGRSFSYPSILTDPLPFSVSSWSIAVDSIKVTFDNKGNYTFSNFQLPIDRGSYSIVQDSLLIIKPDTAGLLKFSYSTPTLSAGSGIPPIYIPYSNFYFSSDTILFKNPSADKLVFATFWLSKAFQPIQPSMDTLVINQAISNFKRL